VGGLFTTLNGVDVPDYLIRLNADGTEDTTFSASLGAGFDGQIQTISIQSDGKILVGGQFTTLNSVNVPDYLIRLNANGTVDTTFSASLGTGFDGSILTTSIQSDGKILVGGNFLDLNGTARNFLVRLNVDGTEDTAFYTNLGTGFNAQTASISIQSDGKIVVGGNFTALNGTARNYLVRLNVDGTVDTAYNFNSYVYTTSIQSDGKILVGGDFTTLNGVDVPDKLVRLNANGTEDTDFSASLGSGFTVSVLTTSIQSDGKILAGGFFTTLNGVTRNRLVRLTTAAPTLTTAITTTGSSIVLTYISALDTSTPATTDYVVNVNALPITVSSVVVSGSTVTLAVTPAITSGQVVTVDYTIPATNPVRGSSGANVVALVSQAVTNSVPVPVPVSSSGGGGGVVIIPLGCTDVKATNYSNPNFVNHVQSLCVYLASSTTPNTNTKATTTNDIFQQVVASTSCPKFGFNTFARLGDKKEVVIKIKGFLNKIFGTKLDTSSNLFDKNTQIAVHEFQTKYSEEVLKPWDITTSTGYWYKTTTRKANSFEDCK
jgi:uncharacterized repeat protein (TIGR02059 family)/uncharacterized delta-60 repeat protein